MRALGDADVAEAIHHRTWASTWEPPADDGDYPPWALRRLGAHLAARPPALTLDAIGECSRRVPDSSQGAWARLVIYITTHSAESGGAFVVDGGFAAVGRAIRSRHDRDARALLDLGTAAPALWSWCAVAVSDGRHGRRMQVRISPTEAMVGLRSAFAPLPDPDDRPPLIGGSKTHGPQWVLFGLVFFSALRQRSVDAAANGGSYHLPPSWWHSLASDAGISLRHTRTLMDAYTGGSPLGPAVLTNAADGRFVIAPSYGALGDALLRGAVRSERNAKGGRARAANAERIDGRFAKSHRLTFESPR